VSVRGGRFVTESTGPAGGIELWRPDDQRHGDRSGCRLELQVNGAPIVTSTMQSVTRLKGYATSREDGNRGQPHHTDELAASAA
jgi:hypothetical protein